MYIKAGHRLIFVKTRMLVVYKIGCKSYFKLLILLELSGVILMIFVEH